MKEREVFLWAAEQIASGKEDFSCNAVRRKSCRLRDKYADVMGREIGGVRCDLDISDIESAVNRWHDGEANSQRRREFRVLLLCMMAACCDDMRKDG